MIFWRELLMSLVVVIRKSMVTSSHFKKLMCSLQVDCFLETTGKSISFVLVLQILQTKSAASVFFILLANGGHMVGSRSIPDKDKGKDRHTDRQRQRQKRRHGWQSQHTRIFNAVKGGCLGNQTRNT